MRYSGYITEQTRWVLFTPESLTLDFKEYKKKEDRKWKLRASEMGFRFPIFRDKSDFKRALDKATIKTLSKGEAQGIGNVALNNSLEDVESMVSSYIKPRDVERIATGLKSKDKLPMPIILKGKRGLFILAGNTRLNVSYIMGVKPKVAIIDVSGE